MSKRHNADWDAERPRPAPPEKKRCEDCGELGYAHSNGRFACPNMACKNFPYITDQNRRFFERPGKTQ